MRTLGRIILLVVGIILVAYAIPTIINSVNYLNVNGWGHLFSDATKKQYFVSILSQGVYALFGITALFAFLRGRSSFWLTIFSLIMIGFVVWYFISAKNAGTLGDWKNVLSIILGFSLPISYFIGSLLVRAK